MHLSVTWFPTAVSARTEDRWAGLAQSAAAIREAHAAAVEKGWTVETPKRTCHPTVKTHHHSTLTAEWKTPSHSEGRGRADTEAKAATQRAPDKQQNKKELDRERNKPERHQRRNQQKTAGNPLQSEGGGRRPFNTTLVRLVLFKKEKFQSPWFSLPASPSAHGSGQSRSSSSSLFLRRETQRRVGEGSREDGKEEN